MSCTSSGPILDYFGIGPGCLFVLREAVTLVFYCSLMWIAKYRSRRMPLPMLASLVEEIEQMATIIH